MQTPSTFDPSDALPECLDALYDEEFEDGFRRQLKKKNNFEDDEFWDEDEFWAKDGEFWDEDDEF